MTRPSFVAVQTSNQESSGTEIRSTTTFQKERKLSAIQLMRVSRRKSLWKELAKIKKCKTLLIWPYVVKRPSMVGSEILQSCVIVSGMGNQQRIRWRFMKRYPMLFLWSRCMIWNITLCLKLHPALQKEQRSDEQLVKYMLRHLFAVLFYSTIKCLIDLIQKCVALIVIARICDKFKWFIAFANIASIDVNPNTLNIIDIDIVDHYIAEWIKRTVFWTKFASLQVSSSLLSVSTGLPSKSLAPSLVLSYSSFIAWPLRPSPSPSWPVTVTSSLLEMERLVPHH